MKYIITESRLHDVMTEYLESFVERNDVHHLDSFIVISRFENNVFATSLLEYDSWDGRLFIDRNFLDTFINWFGGNDDYSQSFISKWFEKKYDVEVKYVQS